jgi:cysteine desulfurase
LVRPLGSLAELAASLGSACHAESDAVSGVLAVLGIDMTRAMGAVRLSVGWMTTEEEVERAATALIAAFVECQG